MRSRRPRGWRAGRRLPRGPRRVPHCRRHFRSPRPRPHAGCSPGNCEDGGGFCRRCSLVHLSGRLGEQGRRTRRRGWQSGRPCRPCFGSRSPLSGLVIAAFRAQLLFHDDDVLHGPSVGSNAAGVRPCGTLGVGGPICAAAVWSRGFTSLGFFGAGRSAEPKPTLLNMWNQCLTPVYKAISILSNFSRY